MTAPDQLSIETPEQVALEFPLAGVGSRFLALSVDMLLQLVIGLVVLAAVAGGWSLLGRSGGGAWFLAVIVITIFLLFYGYFAAFEAFWHGQTPGKRLVGLRVLSVTGRPARIDEAILRNLLRVIDQLPGVYAIGILTMLISARNQRLGDLAAGTVVVHEKLLTAPIMTVAPPAAGGWSGGAGLTEAELLLAETFLQRRHELPTPIRESHAQAIADRLRARLGSAAPALESEALIEALHARARTRGGR
ncbi:MAG: RDD family protein [Vicinamibacteraceae bacterium]